MMVYSRPAKIFDAVDQWTLSNALSFHKEQVNVLALDRALDHIWQDFRNYCQWEDDNRKASHAL